MSKNANNNNIFYIDRQKANNELSELVEAIYLAKAKIASGELSMKEGETLLDNLAAGLSKMNKVISKFDKFEVIR